MYVPSESDLRMAVSGLMHANENHAEFRQEKMDTADIFAKSEVVQTFVDKVMREVGAAKSHLVWANLSALVMFGYILRDEIEEMYEDTGNQEELHQHPKSEVAFD